MSHSSGVSFQNRYPYSAKIICEEHNTTFHRQVLENKKGKQEVWQCKVYRSHGRSGCSAPQIRSSEVDAILTEIFKELMKDKQAIIDSLVKVITSVPKEVDYDRLRSRVQEEMDEIEKKKDRLLDLSIAGALDAPEFKKRNDALNVRLRECESQLSAIRQEEERAVDNKLNEAEIRRVLDRELSFEGEPNSALLTTILDKIVVKKGSTKEEIHLDIYLKLGQQYEAIYSPGTLPTSINRLKNTTPKPPTRRI